MQTRTGLGSVSTSSGNVTTAFAVDTLEDHNPLEGPGNPVPTVESVFGYDGQIYACGDWWTTAEQGQPIFDDPDGKSNQYNVGRFDPTSGTPDRVAGTEKYERYPATYPPTVVSETAQAAVARIEKEYGNRPWGPRNDGGVADCIPDPTSGLMYVAGHWDFVTGPNSFTDTLPIGKIIAVDLDSGLTINTWDAETNSERGLDALAVIPGEAIIIGGAFTQSGGQNLNGLARFNLLSASTLPAPQPELDVLLVVADPASLQAGETEIKDRLETQGATVTVADDNTVTVADADSSDVVLVSQGVSSSAVNTKLNNTTTGVAVWKPSLYDDMGLTASAGGTLAGQTQVDVVDPTHPIADGLTGTVTVYDPAKKVTHGTPAATATVVADTAGASTTPVIFTYDTGDTLANSTAAAGRRVGFYFDTNAPTVASSDGWALFDNTVTWTANSPPPISQRSTVSLGGVAVATVSEGEVTWLVADNLGSPTVTYRAVGKTPASVALYYPYGQPRTAQIEGTGTGFTGQVSDLESGTGLAFYNARYYDPALGRFTQPDTIIPNPNNGQDYNRYSYVRNNPVNFTDPSGRCINSDGTIMAGFPECDQPIPSLVEGEPPSLLSDAFPTLTVFDITFAFDALGDAFLYDSAQRNTALYQQLRLEVCDCRTDLAGILLQDVKLALVVLSFAPVTGEIIDAVACISDPGVLNCGAFFVPGLSSKTDDVVGGAIRRLCSFSADTEVLMADGTTKQISEIQIGDWVLAQDPETGERGARQVTALWVHQDTLVALNIDGADVTTTEDHPFWNATDNQWQRADLLDTDDYVLAADGDLLKVNGIDWTSTTTGTAYNLTINNINTYYVQVGNEQVLVHNTCHGDLVSDILKTKKGSITSVELPPGSPSWDDILDMPFSQIEAGAKANLPGYKTIKKLLTDGRFNR